MRCNVLLRLPQYAQQALRVNAPQAALDELDGDVIDEVRVVLYRDLVLSLLVDRATVHMALWVLVVVRLGVELADVAAVVLTTVLTWFMGQRHEPREKEVEVLLLKPARERDRHIAQRLQLELVVLVGADEDVLSDVLLGVQQLDECCLCIQ